MAGTYDALLVVAAAADDGLVVSLNRDIITDRVSTAGNAIASVRSFVSTLSFESTGL